MASHREDKDKRYNCGNRNSQDFPTTKGCQHPTSIGSQHYPKIHLSNSSLHSCSRNLQKVSQWKPPAPIRLDPPPQNSSGRHKTPHSYSPPFQPPSFHHVRQTYLLYFHGCCQELFNIEGLCLQIQRSLNNHQEPPR